MDNEDEQSTASAPAFNRMLSASSSAAPNETPVHSTTLLMSSPRHSAPSTASRIAASHSSASSEDEQSTASSSARAPSKMPSTANESAALITHHWATGYADFIALVERLTSLTAGDQQPINVFFSGQKIDGQSWCADSVIAEPMVMAAMQRVNQRPMHFVYVDVGDRAVWEDALNPFRTDERMRLREIPTLLRWGQPQRVDGCPILMPQQCETFFRD